MDYIKRLATLKERVGALIVENEKKAGSKKIATVEKEIMILAQIKEGTPYYDQLVKKIEHTLDWVPGQAPIRESKSVAQVIDEMFGTKDKVFCRTVLLISDDPIPNDISIKGVRVFSKDSDKTRVNYRVDGNPEIITRSQDQLILHRDLIPEE